MKPFSDPRLYVNKTTHKGWGVFTKANIKKGTITEVFVSAKIRYEDMKKETENVVIYVYASKPRSSLGTGFGPYYNHGPKANVDFYKSKEGLSFFKANRDIEANEEICMNYGVFKGWDKPEEKIVFNAKKIKDYIYIDKRLYLDYNNNPISKKVKRIDQYIKKTSNNNLIYNVFAKKDIKKNTIIEITKCLIFNKIKIDKKNTLSKLFFYNKSKMILPFGFSNLYAVKKKNCNVDIILLEDNRLKFITNKDINKNEKLIIKSKTF